MLGWGGGRAVSAAALTSVVRRFQRCASRGGACGSGWAIWGPGDRLKGQRIPNTPGGWSI